MVSSFQLQKASAPAAAVDSRSSKFARSHVVDEQRLLEHHRPGDIVQMHKNEFDNMITNDIIPEVVFDIL